ncbi:MAG TPA: pantoate--beta-alanine ligase [Polyangiaceae bacterium]|nr:pantoate--beta-alanine ligase [Polyangiaceae bacterium]
MTRAVEFRDLCEAARRRGDRVGFVPTMGALHAGHLGLVAEARKRAGFVVVSIFVNPTQFGPNEDLAKYPRDLAADLARLAPLGVNAVFAPQPSEMYLAGEDTRVHVGKVAEPLCGRTRPGHFTGVATVVAKLFNLAGPSVAVFGRKDYQQLLVIRRMARDLFAPVEIVGLPTVREPDGLAMSSRNAYLSKDDRLKALALARGLSAASRAFGDGERVARVLEAVARTPVEEVASSIDYVDCRDPEDLGAIDGRTGARALLAIACRIGGTRLIDNVVLGEDPPPLSSPR